MNTPSKPRRSTKIVATLGPASSDPDTLEKMIRAGVNVVRLNFSHGVAQDHIDRARLVREAAARAGRGRAPGEVVVGQRRGEVLQQDVALRHEAGEVSPRVSVVDARGVRHLMFRDQAIHPADVLASSALFFDRQFGRLLAGFGAVQRVVRPVARRFGNPLAVRAFQPNPEPLAVFPFVNRRHVASVTNNSKTGNK